MRYAMVLVLGVLPLLAAFALPAAPATPSGNYWGRIRANDAPTGGRLSIYGYLLDTLDVALDHPRGGRFLVLNFRDANGKDSFIIPGDLVLTDKRSQPWNNGFFPLEEERLAGLLPRDEMRWALWWVPGDEDSLSWPTIEDLTLNYGFASSRFVPLDAEDVGKVIRALPWDAITAAEVDLERPSTALGGMPDAAAFDQPPQILEKIDPVYPRNARLYDFEGTVHVLVSVDSRGRSTDASVIHSDAQHLLNVSALAAVMEWRFQPGRKNGKRVAGEMVIPVRFTLGSEQ